MSLSQSAVAEVDNFKLSSQTIQAREAIAEDNSFIKQVFASVRGQIFASIGLPEAQISVLMDQQFRAKSADFARNYPNLRPFIIAEEQVNVGYFQIEISNSIHLADISLLPEFRGKGFGSQVLFELQAQAAHLGKRICLEVDPLNRAYNLYVRHGFVETKRTDTDISMIWTPVENQA